ncbi:MAG: Nramp family divalent metal transporter, partial [Woeseia sp.]
MQASKNDDRGNFWQAFGPGILFAGAAIGTSHLVQSTRAGAVFGLGLLGIIIFANFIKYPAFRFGPQYAAATGKSLVEGYFQMGRWVLVLYLLGEIAVMAIIIAATATVTAAILMANVGVTADIRYMSIGLIIFGVFVLSFGGYKLLDRLTKIFVAILTVATVIAAIISLPSVEWEFGQIFFPLSDLQTLGFVIALMGFMPSALDLAVMQSLWSVAKQKASGVRPSLKQDRK